MVKNLILGPELQVKIEDVKPKLGQVKLTFENLIEELNNGIECR